LQGAANQSVKLRWSHGLCGIDIIQGRSPNARKMQSIKRRLTRTSPFSAFGRASLVHVAQRPPAPFSLLRARSIDLLDIALLKDRQSDAMSLTQRFSKAPEGTAVLFFIQIFATLGFAVLYSTLVRFSPKPKSPASLDRLAIMLAASRRKVRTLRSVLRDEASAALGESGHDVDGRVWRLQLRPAPFRRLPRRPFPLEPESFRRGHGAPGHLSPSIVASNNAGRNLSLSLIVG
jgi:hypothetical protein